MEKRVWIMLSFSDYNQKQLGPKQLQLAVSYFVAAGLQTPCWCWPGGSCKPAIQKHTKSLKGKI